MQIALTIAGSDSGGGAGIQADLKTFHQFGVFGTSVVTAITAQNTVSVRTWEAVGADLVIRQLEAVAEDLPPHAVNYTKIALNVALKQMTGAAFEMSLGYEIYSMGMNDFREATTAFVQKRKGVFKGN